MRDARGERGSNLSLRTVRTVLCFLLTVLVMMQSIGVLHRVAHAHHTHSIANVTHQSSDLSGHDALGTVIARLWGEHSNAVECQLFDHASPDFLHLSVALLMTHRFLPDWISIEAGEHYSQFERFYAAQGPPAALI